jgi:hypothetical protein
MRPNRRSLPEIARPIVSGPASLADQRIARCAAETVLYYTIVSESIIHMYHTASTTVHTHTHHSTIIYHNSIIVSLKSEIKNNKRKKKRKQTNADTVVSADDSSTLSLVDRISITIQ